MKTIRDRNPFPKFFNVVVLLCLVNINLMTAGTTFHSSPGVLPHPPASGSILSWHTFMGGMGTEEAIGIVRDETGNFYVSGYSSATWGQPIQSHTGGWDIYVAKFNENGLLLWNTFLGGSGSDYGKTIVLDANGNLYVTGESNIAWGNPVNTHSGNTDAFVCKLNNEGVLQWNTFLGGADYDTGMNIDMDGNGNVFVIGNSEDGWGTPLNSFTWSNDLFVAMLNSNGELQWNTFLGGMGFDWGNGLTVDDVNTNIYITGHSNASWGTPLSPYTGGDDVFVAKLDGTGALQWNTFLGGTGNDWAREIVRADTGNLYITGWSAGWGSPIHPHSGGADMLVAKLDENGLLQWHTFVGGTGGDMANGLTIDEGENIYITGEAGETWGTPLHAFSGYSDIVIAKLYANGMVQWHTFLGGDQADWGRGILLDDSGKIFVTGYSDTIWGEPLSPFAGSGDGVLLKLTNSFTISGNAGGPGVKLTYVVNSIIETVVSDRTGNYSILVPEGWSGSIIPSKQCAGKNSLTRCYFFPTKKAYFNVTSDKTKQNFVLKRIY